MISSNDFRTGTTIEIDGAVWRVVEFLHVKPGKGSAFVRTKLKAVKSGNVVGEDLPRRGNASSGVVGEILASAHLHGR